ncbi:EARP-interacting protein homolog isoform X2 [Macrobrachium rosenbergii]|uniref:EARP-interacting protein homolog isoform X2 n=1 Tax=Macrobrachium rosenbergii TaxID=79674 RepID=UPI0034D79955
MDDAPVIYGLEDFQARALAAHTAETEKINFLVGTQSLRRINQVQLIEFDDDTSLVTKQTFEHPAGEIWKIVGAPQSVHMIATVYNNTQDYCGEFGAALWRLPLEGSSSTMMDDNSGGEQVEKVCSLDGRCEGDPQVPGSPVMGLGSQMWSVVWAPEDDSRLVTLVDNHLYLWDIKAAGRSAKVTGEVTVEGRGSVSLGSGRWYPHQLGSQVAATHGSSVRAWDLRTMKPSWCVEAAHVQLVRDLDFNPNMQYYMATCGDDCKTKFWDIRNTQQPLKELTDHSHWVWSVRYNASYDQLVLTCSSDQRVILSNLPSIASQPFGTMVDQEETNKEEKDKPEGSEEGVIQIYDDHEDSVYAVEWSAADFWTFASLSYDGRLVINKVPRSIKYKQFM